MESSSKSGLLGAIWSWLSCYLRGTWAIITPNLASSWATKNKKHIGRTPSFSSCWAKKKKFFHFILTFSSFQPWLGLRLWGSNRSRSTNGRSRPSVAGDDPKMEPSRWHRRPGPPGALDSRPGKLSWVVFDFFLVFGWFWVLMFSFNISSFCFCGFDTGNLLESSGMAFLPLLLRISSVGEQVAFVQVGCYFFGEERVPRTRSIEATHK